MLRTAKERARKLVRLERRSPLQFRRPDLLARGFLSDRAYLYPEVPSFRRGYISDYAIEFRLRRVNPPEVNHLIADKRELAAHLDARGLAASQPRTLGRIRDGALNLNVTPEVIDRHGAVIKPVRGSQGRDVRVVTSFEALRALASGYTDGLVQDVVEPARYARDIWPGSLNTIRVLGLRDEHGAFVGPAAHRFGNRSTGVVDNFSAGGFVARVGVDGTLGPLVAKPMTRARRSFDHHPDSGARVADVRVPSWSEACDLIVALMEAVPGALHVGWDVALTDDGPMVIEGNGGIANLNVFQANGPLLTDARIGAFYRRHRVTRR